MSAFPRVFKGWDKDGSPISNKFALCDINSLCSPKTFAAKPYRFCMYVHAGGPML